MLAIVAPGQGAQTPGFLAPWIQDANLAALLASYSDAAEVDLLRLGTTADAEEIRETSYAQPLLVAAGLLSFHALGAPVANFFAGHSVGEITAAAAAGALTESESLKLVGIRGRAMSQAANGTNTGMAAVLGGEREVVVAALAALNLTPANENGAGQIVAAGALAQIEELIANPPAGSRVRPLAVSGAFHTQVMAPAVAALTDLLPKLTPQRPKAALFSNKEGAIISDGAEFLNRIVGQVSGPVRWDLCMSAMRAAGVTGLLELAPGGTLVGLVKRAEPTIATYALKTPEEIAGALEFISNHQA